MEKCEIYPVQNEDLDEIYTLCNVCLGKNYISKNELINFPTQPFIALKAVYQNQLAGIAVGRKIAWKDFKKILHEHLVETEINLNINDNKIVGWRKHLCVYPHMRNKGIGKMLSVRLHQSLIHENITPVFSFIWDYPGNIMANMLSGMGYKTLGKIAYFWKHESLQKNYECPICGCPCICNAKLMMYEKK